MPLKPAHIAQFYRRLGARGETATSLAAQLGLQQHTYVSRLVYGHGRRRDGVWWPKLKALLTVEELALIDPPPQFAYPTLRDAVAALARAESARPVDLTAAAFLHWKQQHRKTA